MASPPSNDRGDSPAHPDISIVVATYDRPEALECCLRSLIQQRTNFVFEIIVVDNHPNSGRTAATVLRFPSVRWYEQQNRGLSYARNLGIDVARGDVIVTTDDDVIAPPGWLGRLAAPLFDSAEPSLAVTTGNCLALKIETEAERVFEAYGGLRHGDSAAIYDLHWLTRWRICFPQLWRIGTTANAAFRTSVLRNPAVGLFETRLGAGSKAGAWEDLYAFYRVLRAGHSIRYLPDAILLHSHRETIPELTHQLLAYRRGETAFLALVLFRHRDWRALGQMLIWIPWWRFRLFLGELVRRLHASRTFPLGLMLRECAAYLSGPAAVLFDHLRHQGIESRRLVGILRGNKG